MHYISPKPIFSGSRIMNGKESFMSCVSNSDIPTLDMERMYTLE